MGRRVSSGVVGGTGLGSLSVVSSTISSTSADGDITLDPNGAGEVLIESNLFLHDQADLRLGDADSSNYVAFQAPATLTTDITWTLPDEDAQVSGYALTSDGAGALSWAAAGAALTDNNSDAATNYLTFTTSTSGFLTAARVATTTRVLSYQPSTGTLSTTEMTVNGNLRHLRTENVKTASHTLELADWGKNVTFNNSTSATVTVPPNSSVAFAIGTIIYITKVGTGDLTLAAGAGVTLNKTGNFNDDEEIYLRQRSANNWIVVDQSTSLTGTGGSVSSAGGYTIHTYSSTGNDTFVLAS